MSDRNSRRCSPDSALPRSPGSGIAFPECDEHRSNAGCEDAPGKDNGEWEHGNAWPGSVAFCEELIEYRVKPPMAASMTPSWT